MHDPLPTLASLAARAGSLLPLAASLLLACGDDAPRATPDAATEDAAADATGEDASAGETWDDCPAAGEHVADAAWTETFTHAEDLILCATVGENNDGSPIGDVFRNKLMLRLPRGTYRLPSEDGVYDYTLPLCAKTSRAGAPAGIAGAGSVEKEDASIVALQPMVAGSARMIVYDTDRVFEFCVSGEDCTLEAGGPDMRFIGGTCAPSEDNWTTPKPGVFVREKLTVVFEGGELTFDVVTITGSENPDIIGLYPVAGPLLSVAGTYEGTAVVTNNYWEMAYAATHHAFGKYFGVVLPEPIGDTCAIEVGEATGGGAEAPYAIHRLNCDFERIGELEYQSHSVE
jgi:hypothetical protein